MIGSERLFIDGDVHYSREGNQLVFDNIKGELLNRAARDPTGGEAGAPPAARP